MLFFSNLIQTFKKNHGTCRSQNSNCSQLNK